MSSVRTKNIVAMCAAIRTPLRELSSLASKIEGLLKDSMNCLVELTSAKERSLMQPEASPENNRNQFGLGMGIPRRQIRPDYHK